jgi:hypothetical protein
MHARYAAAAALLLGSLAVLTPACSATLGEPEEDSADEQDAIAIMKAIPCKGLTPEKCSEKCAEEGDGLYCISRRFHPTNKAIGKGDLYKCSTTPFETCAYRFSNGEVCYFFSGLRKPFCLIIGG